MLSAILATNELDRDFAFAHHHGHTAPQTNIFLIDPLRKRISLAWLAFPKFSNYVS